MTYNGYPSQDASHAACMAAWAERLKTGQALLGVVRTLNHLTTEGKFCGINVCTGAAIEIPVVMNPDRERVALSLTLACCIFCVPVITEAFPKATVTY